MPLLVSQELALLNNFNPCPSVIALIFLSLLLFFCPTNGFEKKLEEDTDPDDVVDSNELDKVDILDNLFVHDISFSERGGGNANDSKDPKMLVDTSLQVGVTCFGKNFSGFV